MISFTEHMGGGAEKRQMPSYVQLAGSMKGSRCSRSRKERHCKGWNKNSCFRIFIPQLFMQCPLHAWYCAEWKGIVSVLPSSFYFSPRNANKHEQYTFRYIHMCVYIHIHAYTVNLLQKYCYHTEADTNCCFPSYWY